MISFQPCQDWHLGLIDAQDAQVEDKAFHIHGAAELVANSLALSAWIDDRCVGAGGIRPIWQGRAAAWTLLGRDAGPAMPAIARKLRFVLATWPARRIELTVREDFAPGCRMAALLGFAREAVLPAFFPDGAACYLYARLKG